MDFWNIKVFLWFNIYKIDIILGLSYEFDSWCYDHVFGKIFDFPLSGDIYIFPGCQVIKFAANPESPPALGLIQTNHSMPVSRHHDDDGDDDMTMMMIRPTRACLWVAIVIMMMSSMYLLSHSSIQIFSIQISEHFFLSERKCFRSQFKKFSSICTCCLGLASTF